MTPDDKTEDIATEMEDTVDNVVVFRKSRLRKQYPFERMENMRVTGADSSVVYVGYDKKAGKKGVRFNRDRLTIALAAKAILEKQGTMTLRGLYYALFGAGWIPNSQEVYKGLLVKANREGHDPDKARGAYLELKRMVDDALATYEAAIAQPAPKVRAARVVL